MKSLFVINHIWKKNDNFFTICFKPFQKSLFSFVIKGQRIIKNISVLKILLNFHLPD